MKTKKVLLPIEVPDDICCYKRNVGVCKYLNDNNNCKLGFDNWWSKDRETIRKGSDCLHLIWQENIS